MQSEIKKVKELENKIKELESSKNQESGSQET